MRLSYLSLSVVTLSLSATIAGRDALAGGQCPNWLSGPLHNQPQGTNANGIISASAVWSPPTGGTFLVVAGGITTAGGVPVNGLAAWDGASWRDLGGGVDFSPQVLAVYNGDLIVGGNFDFAGGVPAVNIARYDGTNWHALGQGLTGAMPPGVAFCTALAVFNGDLIAGGHFQTAGGVTATNIARWNGTSWSAMGSGVGQPSDVIGGVNVLRVHTNNVLYIGGFFSTAGGLPAALNIVQFNGTSYAIMEGGTGGNNPSVRALHSFGNDLVVGGDFITADVLFVNHVARWTPGAGTSGTWGTMDAGLGVNLDSVVALQPFNSQLVAGGTFSGSVRAWNGSIWTTLGTGMTGGVGNDPRTFTLNVFNGNLIAAGTFSTAGGATATSIAQRSISPPVWSALQAPPPQVFAFETLGSRFIAAGSFLQSTTSQTPAHNIIGWNGSTLTRVQNSICCGEGTNGTIRALKSNSGFGTNELFVVGDFTVAGGVTANRVAKYSDALFTGGWSALGNGFNAPVLAVERVPANQFFTEAIYVGGAFTASGTGSPSFNRVAVWTGSPASWFTLGTGFNNTVRALKGFNVNQIASQVVAGGDFTTASGVAANRIAIWHAPNQNGWIAMGSGFNAPVHAIERHNGVYYAAGEFTASGATPINRVARWTGTAWESVSGGTNGVVTALKSDGTNIYAIGGFTSAGGVAVNRVARWNATEGWSDVEGGTNDLVNALGLFHGEVQVGLGITLESGGGPEAAPQPGKGWVRYNPTGVAWTATNPFGQTVNCGQTVTFTSQPAQGYSLLLATWSRNGVALVDGPTPQGSTISGAHAGTLTISNVRAADAGSYTCSFANLCGAATSSAAMLTVNNCCAPDINGDNLVNMNDLVAVIMNWGACPAPPAACLGNVNTAGPSANAVDADDLLAVISGWGACP